MIVCPNCQYKNVTGAMFCAECGAQLDGVDTLITQAITDEQIAEELSKKAPRPEPAPPVNSWISLHLMDSGKILPLERYGVRMMSIGFIATGDTPVIWRGPLVARMLQQFLVQVEWGELDYLVVDLPPGTGDAQLTLSQQCPLSGAVIVTTPQEVALEDVYRAVQMFGQVRVPILGIVENMSGFACPHCGEVTTIDLLEAFGRHFLGWVNRWQEDGVKPVRQAWLSRATGLGKQVEIRLDHQLRSGTFESITESGAIRLVKDGVAQTIALDEAMKAPTWSI